MKRLPWASKEAAMVQSYRWGEGFRRPGAALAPAPTSGVAVGHPTLAPLSFLSCRRKMAGMRVPAPTAPHAPPCSCEDSGRLCTQAREVAPGTDRVVMGTAIPIILHLLVVKILSTQLLHLGD